MNKYDDDLELTQQIARVSKETCDEHTPEAVRKELKNTVYILSGSILVIGAGIMLIISMLRDDISIQGKDIRAQGKTLNKIYEVASRLEITESRVSVNESCIFDLKKKEAGHYVKLTDRITKLEQKIGNN